MDSWTRRHTLAIGSALTAATLAACTAQQDDAPGSGASDGTDEASPAASPEGSVAPPEGPVETRTVITDGGSVEVAVHPVVRAGDLCVLTLDLAATHLPANAEAVSARRFTGDATLVGRPVVSEEWAAVRLIDPGGARIRLPASTTEGEMALRASPDAPDIPAEGTRIQLVYAAPDPEIEELGLLIPGWYIPQLPVVEGDIPEVDPPSSGTLLSAQEMLAMAEDLPVLPLEGYTRQIDGGVGVVESVEKVEIRLAGDILFDSSSATIRPEAGDVLDAAAATISGYEGGVVDVAGHTDDVGSEADNIELSRDRAEAVAQALASRIDTSLYSLQTEGLGESQPFVANDSDAGRQLNRRVTLTLTAKKTEQTTVSTAGDVPPFDDGILHDGSEADALEGFERTEGGVTYRVTAPSIRRVDGLLVLTVVATRVGEAPDEVASSAFDLFAGVYSYRGDRTGFSSNFAGFAPRLLLGATAVYPLDYSLGESAIEGDIEWRNASDPSTSDRAPVGDELQYVALYRDQPGIDSFIVDQPPVLGSSPYRLNGVEVQQ